jgi:putative nucleotidyltransferase with HDIG domain
MSTVSEHPGEEAAKVASDAAPAQPSTAPAPKASVPSLAARPLAIPSVNPIIHEVLPSLPPLVPTVHSERPSIDPVESLPIDSQLPSAEDALERELVRQLRTGRAALPLLPQVAEAALRLANDPDARIDQLARLVDTDPPIAARFMSVANSVAYWRGLVAASTQSAIVRLGLANTRDLLFQVVYAASTTGLKKYQTAVLRSFKRSVVAAIAARTTAQELKLSGEYDYMSGLLHDIGEARVYRILDGITLPVEDKASLKRLVQKYHCVAGAEVAMAWKLPTEIVDACAAHHDEGAAENPHVRLVMIADLIVESLETATLSKPPNFAAFERLGITPELARVLIDKTEKGVGENRNSLRP